MAFHRVPGVPPVAITRLPDAVPAASGPPGGGPHAHDFLVLFYVHRAEGTVVIDGRPWTVTDGHVFVIAPGQVVTLSHRVGYPDVSYFIKRFRAHHGMTPAQWRHAASPLGH